MPAEVLPPTEANLARAAAALAWGEVVAMPTETVYGLAGVAFDEQALASIFAAKERPTFDPLICHVPALVGGGDWLEHLAQQRLVNVSLLSELARSRAQTLAQTFWPGALTMVLPKLPDVPDLATSGLPTVGVRCPRHPVAQRLLALVGAPLAAPSANRFGRLSPTTAAHVVAELGARIEWIIDGGPCEIGLESTVVLIEPAGEIRLLRPGGVSQEALESAIGAQSVRPEAENGTGDTPLPSPGLLASHYAPRKPLRTFAHDARWPAQTGNVRVGWLVPLGPAPPHLGSANVEVLSPAGDSREAARRLFAALRALDDAPAVDEIWAQLCSDDARLGYAINDRLRKASHR